ncbi:UDP-glucose 4-epimerase family protein [Aquipseudomonas ullengensis]|uniref:SDR family oxidoreductase n=1 Tax=Aquipseudomonas ullengensis TaxID=2759166 RepID=A0A7W4LKQ8_9GAMM|nr:SDR family oxidoreductase [Pseudomonas ullengensis]MBB2494993.1 SDR family oxidoreductase [Pseudomonas ullengensis]
MRVLVTGANGFVGSALLRKLEVQPDMQVLAGVRSIKSLPAWPEHKLLVLGDLALSDVAPHVLQGVDVIVHMAARVHVMRDEAPDPLAAFRQANVEGTLRLAKAAAAAGVKRFIYLSSIKVNGEETKPGFPFTASDIPAPLDPYGISKFEAEQALQQLALDSALEVVIIRPPLIYGPGVRANFRSMLRWLSIGVPLPLGAIHNRRSLVALPNLLDLLHVCLTHPAAVNQVFLVSDGDDLSTTEMLRCLGSALGRPARLLPFPQGLLCLVAKVLGKGDVANRLCGSLQVDITKTRVKLGWQPPVTKDEGLRETAVGFIGGQF